jgi:hypothetical protein
MQRSHQGIETWTRKSFEPPTATIIPQTHTIEVNLRAAA